MFPRQIEIVLLRILLYIIRLMDTLTDTKIGGINLWQLETPKLKVEYCLEVNYNSLTSKQQII